MKALLTVAAMVALLTGCNAVTNTADGIMKKQSNFSQDPATVYPTVDGSVDGQPADFGKQQF